MRASRGHGEGLQQASISSCNLSWPWHHNPRHGDDRSPATVQPHPERAHEARMARCWIAMPCPSYTCASPPCSWHGAGQSMQAARGWGARGWIAQPRCSSRQCQCGMFLVAISPASASTLGSSREYMEWCVAEHACVHLSNATKAGHRIGCIYSNVNQGGSAGKPCIAATVAGQLMAWREGARALVT